MAALPQPPLHDQLPPEEPRRPRRNWRKIAGWTAAGLAGLILVVVMAVFVLLRSPRFHQYVLGKAERAVSEALGTKVRARQLRLQWSGISPAADLYDVVVNGAPPYTSPPLLTVERIHAVVKVTSLFRRTWYIDDITVERPVVRVIVDKQGVDNVPKPKPTAGQSKTNLFDLGIRHARLERGDLYYNNRKSVLTADVHELQFQAEFTPAEKRYSGTLSYRDGHVQVANYQPLPHSLDARFSATPDLFTLDHAKLSTGPSYFELQATVADYASPKIKATYNAVVDAGQFRWVMRNPTLPVGRLRTHGNLNYTARPNVPLMEGAVVHGTMTSQEVRLATASFRGALRDLGANYTLQNGDLAVRDMRARLLGGTMNGTLLLRNIAGNTRSSLQAALQGISLAALQQQVRSPALQRVALGGSVNATVGATWGKTFSDLVAHADATLQASLASTAGGNTVPLDGVIHARYAAPTQEIALARSFLRTPQTSVDLNGTVSEHSALQVRMQSNNLHELETLSAMFRAQSPEQAPLGLYGTASFNGSVRGSTRAPRLAGELSAANLRVKGTSWRLVRADVDLSPSAASIQNGVLQPLQRGRINLAVRAGLRDWSFTDQSPFQVSINAAQVNAADLVKAAGLQTPITGTFAANVNARGTQTSPVGQGTVSLTHATVAGEPIDALNLRFEGTGAEVRAHLRLAIPAGNATGDVTYFPKQQGYAAQLEARGIRLDQVEAIKSKSMNLHGVLNLSASGRGTLQDPQVQATAQVPQLQVRDQVMKGVTLQADVAHHVARFNLDSQVLNTSAHGEGTVALAGDYHANAKFDTQLIPLEPLVAAYAPSQAGNLTGQTEVHATLRGPLKNKKLLEAHITVPRLALNYKNTVQLAAAQPIRADYSNGVLELQRASIRGTGTDLQFQGTVPMSSTAPASLLLLGTVDLRIAQLLNPDITSSGQLRFDINSYGARTDPNVQGRIEVVNAAFATLDVPLGLQNGNGVLTLTQDRLNVTRFTGTVGGGTVAASGGVVYRPALQFDLGMEAKGIRLLYPEGVRTQLDTDLALSGSTEKALLRGQVVVEGLSFTPDFDLMNFMGQFGGVATPPPTMGFRNNLALEIGVLTASGMNLVSRELSVQGAANLRVRGTAAQPVVLGRMNIEGGDLIFMGNRYVLQGGTVDLVNPSRTEPVVNVAVNTSIQQYEIQMRFWGPVDHLHTNYSSNPALPPSDIINLIAFGKTTEAAAANPTPPGNLGAQSLIASQVASQVSSRLEKVAGISQLSIDPVLGGNGTGQTPGARIAVQQRVTSKIFVTFATDVTSTQGAAIKLEYQITPRVSVNVVRDQNGGVAVDTRIKKTW